MEAKVVAANYDVVKTSEHIHTAEATTTSKWLTTTRLRIIGVALGVAIGLAVGLGVGLGMKKKNSTELNIPLLKPPVVSASPQGLKGSRRMLRIENENFDRKLVTITTSSAMSTIKTKLFGPGPGDFSYRLGMVDERLQEIKQRAKESDTPKECLSVTSEKFEPKLPNNEAFPMYFSCKEEMSGGQLNVYFGQKDDKYYVAELQKGSGNIPSIAVLASVDSAGNKVDVWQIIVDAAASPKTVSVFHINADKVANTIQVITASTSGGTGVGCGIKMSSTSSSLWAYGYASDNGSPNPCPTGGDYINSVVNADWQSYCVNPSTLLDITPSSTCSTLSSSFPLTAFSYAQLVSTSYANDAYNLIYNPVLPTGLVDFKK